MKNNRTKIVRFIFIYSSTTVYQISPLDCVSDTTLYPSATKLVPCPSDELFAGLKLTNVPPVIITFALPSLKLASVQLIA